MRRGGLLKEQVEESSIDITPMLDVVFILLIFFIVTATFIKEPGVRVNKSEAMTAELKPYANILIAIGPDNTIWIDRKKKDIRDVRPTIERMFAENPKGSVVIQPDRLSKTEILIQIMDAARDANIKDVSISAERP
ncbi:MAG: biopolymer transporter ExbD [Gammaproteobacteria bacterium]|nr:biopolymer transporter ExbD [Gammaproteobacteria bacterium]